VPFGSDIGGAVMAVKPIPEGFHSVTPYLFVDGVARLLDFVKADFDAKEEVCLQRDDGSVMHAVVRTATRP
jgi:PhnB protein